MKPILRCQYLVKRTFCPYAYLGMHKGLITFADIISH